MPAFYSKLTYSKKKEGFGPGMSIFQKYGSFIKKSPKNDKAICVLKPQLGFHRKYELKAYAKKISDLQEKNMGNLFDDYKDLVEFVPENIEIIKNLLYQTWLFNKSEDTEEEPLAIFMPMQCHRIAAAIKIQSIFRGYLFRKKIISSTGLSLNDQITERRAIIYIQKWWQWYKIKRRLEAISSIKVYLRSINSKTLYIEEHIYSNIQKIVNDVKSRVCFPEQKLDFDFSENHVIHPKQKHCEFLGISDRFERQVLPDWVKVDFKMEFFTDMEGTSYGSDVIAL
jgi:hypothetical protein